jgi:iron complex transport system substrate-binding protein
MVSDERRGDAPVRKFAGVTARRGRARLASAAALLVAVAAAGAAAAPGPIPGRIVSTSPSITETLFALGLGDRVVGVSTFCRYPAAVARLPKVGTFLKPDPETIARLRPDLVFVHAGPNAAASQLAGLGIRTAVVDRGALSSVFATIRQIGGAAGVADRADALVAEITAALERVKAEVAGRTPRRVLVIVGRRTGTLTDIIAVGPGSYLHDIVGMAGGVNVMGEAALEYPHISMETIVRLAPEVLIDVGEMGESPADSERRRLVTETLWARQTLVEAVRHHAVHAVHDEAFVVPGPRIVAVARRMAEWFHEVAPR